MSMPSKVENTDNVILINSERHIDNFPCKRDKGYGKGGKRRKAA